MEKPIQTLNLQVKKTDIRGTLYLIPVTAEVYQDLDYTPQDSEDPAVTNIKQLEHDIERGDVTPCFIVVTARWNDIEGSDSLGAVLIRKHGDILATIADHDRVSNAIADLRINTEKAVKAARELIATLGD